MWMNRGDFALGARPLRVLAARRARARDDHSFAIATLRGQPAFGLASGHVMRDDPAADPQAARHRDAAMAALGEPHRFDGSTVGVAMARLRGLGYQRD
jgi:hypothetical protein